MKKIITFLILLIIPINIYAIELSELYSPNVLIYDLTDNEILYKKNSDKKTNIASLTKIMTTITAIEKIDDLNDTVTFKEEMLSGLPSDASLANLVVGDNYTYEDLLYASILPSGADATQALAISLSGSVSKFVNDMNVLAKKIGLNNSHFVNVTGLDIENHYSTLDDILKLLKYSLNNNLFETIYKTKEHTLTTGLLVESTIKKYNKFMNLDTSRIVGSKTGNTNIAGLCMSQLFVSDNHEIISITTGAKYVWGNFYNLKDALNIIYYVDDNYDEVTIIPKDELIKKIKINNSEEYNIYPSEDVTYFIELPKEKDKISYNYDGLENLTHKNKKNDVIGKINYYYDDNLIKSEEVKLNENIPMTFNNIVQENLILIIILIVILFLVVKIIKKQKRRKRRRKKI